MANRPTRAPGTSAPVADRRDLRACPNCGERRIGQFRFCRACGLDYDAAIRASATWIAPDSPAAGPFRLDVRPGSPARPARPVASRPAAPESWADQTLTVGGGRYTITMREAAAVTMAIALVATAIVLFLVTILR